MKYLSRRDFFSALITGLTTGVVAWRILIFLETVPVKGIPWWFLAVVIPLLWLAGVQLGYTLGVFWRPMTQFGRFAAIGFANAAVDFGILYLLIGLTGIAGGLIYAVFKATSFLFASVHSYLWNKFWAFDAGKSGGGIREVMRFAFVALLAILFNTLIATAVVFIPQDTLRPEAWAGVGAIVGSAAAFIFSFIGFRLFVFRRE